MRFLENNIQLLADLTKQLRQAKADEKATAIVDRQLSEKKSRLENVFAELKQIDDDNKELQKQDRELNLEVRKAKAKQGLYDVSSGKYSNYRTPDGLMRLEHELKKHWGISVESYQSAYKPIAEPFSVGMESVSKFKSLKSLGKKLLAEAKEPEFAILNSDVEPLFVSEDYYLRDAWNFMIEKGYLERNKAAVEYYCKRAVAFALLSGVKSTKEKCEQTFHNALTLLGPIHSSYNVCGGRNIFFLPEGVPKPLGDECVSNVVVLSSRPCLDTTSNCSSTRSFVHFRQMKRSKIGRKIGGGKPKKRPVIIE